MHKLSVGVGVRVSVGGVFLTKLPPASVIPHHKMIS